MNKKKCCGSKKKVFPILSFYHHSDFHFMCYNLELNGKLFLKDNLNKLIDVLRVIR